MPGIQELAFVVVEDRLGEAPGGSCSQQGVPAAAGGGGGAAAAAAAAAGPAPSARYTPSLLRQTLQLMGAKQRQSDKAARKAFLLLQQRVALPPGEPLSLAARLVAAPLGRVGVALSRPEFDRLVLDCLAAPEQQAQAAQAEQLLQQAHAPAAAAAGSEPPAAAAARDPASPPPPSAASIPAVPPPALFSEEDLHVACALREQRRSVAILLCGTSGTGKSTLAALLAARLGISTVVSTDSIRHMLRSFSSEEEDPLLWASTYQAGAHLQQLAAAAQGHAVATAAAHAAGQVGQALGAGAAPPHAAYIAAAEAACAACAGDPRKAAVKGYKAQSARVLEHVDRLLEGCEARRQSIVLEGVHLSLSMVVRMMQRHPSAVPFLVHISNEAKHMERFAVRSKVMTLRPDGNRYVKYFRNIRTIQDYLVKSADKHAVPKVDNTNVDRSVATIHATVLGCLRRTARGDGVLHTASLSCKLLLEEYLRCQSATWSSSDMLKLIRRKSAVGEAPSPSDLESTATAPPSTPRETAEELLPQHASQPGRSASRHGSSSTTLAGRSAGEGEDEQEAGGAAGAAGTAGPAAGTAAGVEEEEGDNRSFYGSEGQSDDDGGSTSCSCDSSSSEAGSSASEGEGSAAAGREQAVGPGSSGSSGGDQQRELEEEEERRSWLLDAAPGRPVRRQRHRAGRARGGDDGGDALGAAPERWRRRRSEVGSLLDPEPQSDTEDAELAAATGAAEAAP